ncbi:hypothetical protein HU830_03190 [Lactobacillus sp. DCY120]|uniref:Thiopeptide-type bacteriocin biosynthesis domain-containing protein n=1 Tax=Bombilactobacillus apium TaxID=2675299 RepID=A0A850R2D8_9LACO|nr:hypothetical protein [Bombilactobacillus apium]NVY96181.1 hypothetical protein [Bombilactobacillus apium]
MIAKYTINLNVQTEYKNFFIINYLIPVLQMYRKEGYELFLFRTVENGPVINIFINNIEERKTSEILKELRNKLILFKKEHLGKLHENDIYMREMKNINKMNRLKSNNKFHNFSVNLEELNRINRRGEYRSVSDQETINRWLFKNGYLIEKTICILSRYNRFDKRVFLTSLFIFISEQLDHISLLGYLSFKSHYLGFMSFNKKMKIIHQQLIKDYPKISKRFELNFDSQDGCYITLDSDLNKLQKEWQTVLKDFYNKASKSKTNKASILQVLAMVRFSNLSGFHSDVFQVRNLSFYRSEQFQIYRKLVNLAYMILPSIGLNTVDRIQSAFFTVEIIEGEMEC